MRFHLNQEQELIQDSVRRTLADGDPARRRRRLIDAGDDYDEEAWASLAAIGLHGLMAPEEHGGSQLGVIEAALAMEAIGEAGACGPYLSHLLATAAISRHGSAEIQARWLPSLVAGEAVAAFAPGAGWTPDLWDAEVRDGRLDGAFRFVGGADRAQVFVAGVTGGGLAIAEPGEAVHIDRLEGSDPTRRLWSVRFDAAPCLVLSAERADGGNLLDLGLVLLAADALGGAQRCLDMSVEYAKTRRQFDAPIGQFQAIKHQLAGMALQVEPARALVWYAAHALDAGLEDAARAAAHAKAHLADRFVSVTRTAVEVHGGIGYTWEYDLQLWFRRALFDRAYLGAPSLHRERAARLGGL